MPKIWERAIRRNITTSRQEIQTEGYPSYYLQNFHHQTDGYLSDMSANLYDLQVEILFNGSADAMRRRILAPLKEGLKAFDSVPPQQIRVWILLAVRVVLLKIDPGNSASSFSIWYGFVTRLPA
jgi:hypothetical protein